MTTRRLPPPWLVEGLDACFVVRDHNGQALKVAQQGSLLIRGRDRLFVFRQKSSTTAGTRKHKLGVDFLSMQKRPWLIAASAAVLWLGIGFCLPGPKAESAHHPDVVMLGDSITAWTDWNALLPSFDVANRGIPGDTTEGVLGRIDDIVAMRSRCVAVMVGINDLLSAKPKSVQQILQNYTGIIDRLSTSGSTVIVQSTLVTSNASTNASVIDVDRAIAEMCEQSGHCLYLDLNSTVASTGAIADSDDGVHLGPNSYKIWVRTLTPLLDASCH
jgi:hypothetical protein